MIITLQTSHNRNLAITGKLKGKREGGNHEEKKISEQDDQAKEKKK